MKFENTKLRSFGCTLALLALIVALGLGVSGCMNRGEQQGSGFDGNNGAQASPTPDYMPSGSGENVPNATAQAALIPFDWTKNAAEVEGRIGQISEISEARVVTEGNTALVAVRFNQNYQGEMTERIREMVAAEVMQADPEITTVAVTADDADVQSVYDISDRMRSGAALDDLKQEINEIVRNATTLR